VIDVWVELLQERVPEGVGDCVAQLVVANCVEEEVLPFLR